MPLSLNVNWIQKHLNLFESPETNTPNSNLIWNQWTNSHSVDVPLQISIIYLFIPYFLTSQFPELAKHLIQKSFFMHFLQLVRHFNFNP